MNYDVIREICGINDLSTELDSLANYASKNPYVAYLISARMTELENAIDGLEKRIKAQQ